MDRERPVRDLKKEAGMGFGKSGRRLP